MCWRAYPAAQFFPLIDFSNKSQVKNFKLEILLIGDEMNLNYTTHNKRILQQNVDVILYLYCIQCIHIMYVKILKVSN